MLFFSANSGDPAIIRKLYLNEISDAKLRFRFYLKIKKIARLGYLVNDKSGLENLVNGTIHNIDECFE